MSNELNILNKFITFLEEFKKEKQLNPRDITGVPTYLNKCWNELNLIKYFKYIAKDNTKISQAKLNLAVELKTLLKYYHIQSQILGINALYFLFIFGKSKTLIGLTSSILFASSMSFFYYKFHYSKIFNVMDKLFYNEISFLSQKLKRDQEGFTPKVFISQTIKYTVTRRFLGGGKFSKKS